MRGTVYPGSNNWERQSRVDLFDKGGTTSFPGLLKVEEYAKVELRPGDILRYLLANTMGLFLTTCAAFHLIGSTKCIHALIQSLLGGGLASKVMS